MTLSSEEKGNAQSQVYGPAAPARRRTFQPWRWSPVSSEMISEMEGEDKMDCDAEVENRQARFCRTVGVT